jgi:signal peptidase I
MTDRNHPPRKLSLTTVTALCVCIVISALMFFFFWSWAKTYSRLVPISTQPSSSVQESQEPLRVALPDNPATSSPQIQPSAITAATEKCSVTPEHRTAWGSSLSGIVEAGDIVTVLVGYYACNPVRRGDIVAYDYKGNPDPVTKIVKGVPGDRWHLEASGSAYRIIVNDKALTTSTGEEYAILANRAGILKLYARDYPVIPDKAYLLLGNLPEGTLDATRFGLVGLDSIIGKVVLK